MKNFTLILIIMAALNVAQAQTEILHVDVDTNTTESQFGPNRRHFIHTFMSLGLHTQIPANGNYNFPRSSYLSFGALYKLKLSNYFSTGITLSFENSSIQLAKDRPVTFPDSLRHSKETLDQFALSGSYYLRINMEKRGNSIGKYLDLGVGGLLQTGANYQYEDPLIGKEIKEVKIRHYPMLRASNWYLYTAIGINNFALMARYRMQSFFIDRSGLPEAPPIMIGISWGFF